MRQLGARHVEQQTSVPPFGQLARRHVLLPGLVGDDQRHLGMAAQNLHRLVGAGVVIGDDGIDLAREIIERVGQQQRLVAHTREPDQEMLLAQQRPVTFDDPLRLAELPRACARFHHPESR
jgi:hypothetical protein